MKINLFSVVVTKKLSELRPGDVFRLPTNSENVYLKTDTRLNDMHRVVGLSQGTLFQLQEDHEVIPVPDVQVTHING
ncbi:hypothetical protein [Escherichia phage vB_EcoP_PAS59]|uniref:Uncharacterized protein n=2 Tax=Suseptimavirus TaxID=3044836 RepID=A0AAE8C4K2_9CAUD|nr:hypothetical protein PQC43_gp134 [Escherichia phage vB_EcoP-101114UKE3]EFV9058540.1 hypothetical protein [Shigella sonnei]QZI79250.1 hypothetical protein 101114UKE3_119 [Escherichia phage vB_EcoP-101114UKE3]USM81223.1 hypothetical protein 101114BS3_096 [Escherichia phage vB_EcoP-101114BS3]WMX18847.1 hypothetical protein [Escherichia phage vB_EcoP_PAS59]